MQILNCVSELGTCCSDFGLAATLNIVRNILTIIQIVVPLILIVMSTVSLTKMVINPDEKKGMKKIYNQYLAAVFVFLVPMFVDMLLIMMPNSYSLSACWEQAKDNAELLKLNAAEYKEIDTGKALKKVYGSDYELGEKDFPTITWNGGPVYGQEVVAYLKQFKGMGYRLGCHWDGEIPYSPASCIGVIVGAYKHFGIKIECTEDTSVFLNNPSKYTVVTNEPHHPGDIVIYEGHYAMLTGEGNQIIHSTSSENGIIISNDYRKSGQGLLGIVRVNGVL